MINMNMKVVFCLSVFMVSTVFNFAEASKTLNKIAVVVNSDIITQGELNKKISQMRRRLKQSKSSVPSASVLRRQAIDDLVDISLQLQIAKRNGLMVGDDEVNAVISNIAKTHGMTLAQLKKELPKREGIGFSEFRRQIRDQGLINKIQMQVLAKGIVVNEKDINEVLRKQPGIKNIPSRYYVVDILFETPDDASKKEAKLLESAAKKMLAKLRKRKGGSVDRLIREGNGSLKGDVIKKNDLGWRNAEELPEIFVKKALKMKSGQVVGPIKAPNGLHLLVMRGIQKGSSRKEQAANMAYHYKSMKKLKPWLKDLRKKGYVKVLK